MNLGPSNAKRQPSRRNNGVDSGDALKSAALPPVLFSLPDLGEKAHNDHLDACDSDAELDESCPNEPCSEESVTCQTRQHEPLPVITSEVDEPVDFQPAVETTSVATTAEPPRQEEPQTSDEHPPTVQRDESLVDLWGTRAVVVALLLLVVSSAMVVAHKAMNGTDTKAASQLGNHEEEAIAALGDFAVDDGQPEEADTSVALASKDEVQVDFPTGPAAEVGDTSSPNPPTSSDRESITVPSSVATLQPPTPQSQGNSAKEANPALPESFASSVESVPASTASNRTENSIVADQAQTDTATAESDVVVAPPVEPMPPLPAAEDVVGSTLQENPLVTASATPADKTEESAVRYSSTPTGIVDWTRYFPPADTTTLPANPTP